jgi:hypothetical protein
MEIVSISTWLTTVNKVTSGAPPHLIPEVRREVCPMANTKNSTKAPKEKKLTDADKRRKRELALDQTIEDSFPASDPPSSCPNPEDEDIAA